MRGLPLGESARCQDLVGEYAELGVERLVCSVRYDTSEEFIEQLESLSGIR
jgi:hypothetical protein